MVQNQMDYHDDSFCDSLRICLNGSIFSEDGNQRDYRFKLMQYTGLKDDNGKEVWEGDIVKFDGTSEYGYGEVVFEGGIYWLVEKSGYDQRMDLMSGHEVVGNIFEHPELLK